MQSPEVLRKSLLCSASSDIVYSNSFPKTSDQFGKLVSLFTKPKETRTQQEILSATEILGEFPFFSSMKTEELDFEQLMITTVGLLEYEFVKKGDAVFHYGETGDKFYVIITGSAQVFLPKSEKEVAEEIDRTEKRLTIMSNGGKMKHMNQYKDQIEKCKEKMQDKRMSTIHPFSDPSTLINLDHPRLRRMVSNKEEGSMLKMLLRQGVDSDIIPVLMKFTELYDMYFEDILCKFKKVKTMEVGSHFGELALSSNMPRSATIIASTDLHLLTLTKAAYTKMVENTEKKLEEKVQFFTRLLKDQNSGETILKFARNFKERHYRYGQKIFSQGDQSTYMHIVKQGEVQIVKSEPLANQAPKKAIYMKKEKKMTKRKIAILREFDLLGEAEFLAEKQYEVTAISNSSEATVYILSFAHFKELKVKFGAIFNQLLENHKIKTAYWNTRVQDISQTNQLVEEQNISRIKQDSRGEVSTPREDAPSRSGLPLLTLESETSKASKALVMRSKLGKIIQGQKTENGRLSVNTTGLERLGLDLENNIRYQQNYSATPASLFSEEKTRREANRDLSLRRKEFSQDRERQNSLPQKYSEFKTEPDESSTKIYDGVAQNKVVRAYQKYIVETIYNIKTKSPSVPEVHPKEFRNLRPYEIDALRLSVKNQKKLGNLSISKGISVNALKNISLEKHSEQLDQMAGKRLHLENSRNRILIRQETEEPVRDPNSSPIMADILNIKMMSPVTPHKPRRPLIRFFAGANNNNIRNHKELSLERVIVTEEDTKLPKLNISGGHNSRGIQNIHVFRNGCSPPRASLKKLTKLTNNRSLA